MTDLSTYLSEVFVTFLVSMNVEEYLATNNVQANPMFDLNMGLNEYVEAIEEVEDQAQETELAQEEESMLHMTYGMAICYFYGLKRFLQQQEYNTHGLTLELKKIQKFFCKE